jgi:hypothetical protein
MSSRAILPMIAPAFLLVTTGAHAAETFTPTSAYTRTDILGHTVLVNPELERHPKERERALQELTTQLRQIRTAIPKEHLRLLQRIRIWLEWRAKPRGAAEFHPSRGWLANNGYNPEKEDGVEINNAVNFVKWSRQNQPWMVMHELAHAYHKTVLGHSYKPVADSYKRAMDDKLYHAVANSRGKKVKAYCTNNQKEFFAEMTEAYLGKNDFYPFVRAELEKHDPETYAVIEKIWKTTAGQPRAKKPSDT